jgi:hypothetical protein
MFLPKEPGPRVRDMGLAISSASCVYHYSRLGTLTCTLVYHSDQAGQWFLEYGTSLATPSMWLCSTDDGSERVTCPLGRERRVGFVCVTE